MPGKSLSVSVAEAVTAAQRKESLRHLSVAGNELGTAGFQAGLGKLPGFINRADTASPGPLSQALAESLVETGTQVETIDVGSNGIGEDCSEAWGGGTSMSRHCLGRRVVESAQFGAVRSARCSLSPLQSNVEAPAS